MNNFWRAPLLTLLALGLAIVPLRRASDIRYDEEPGLQTELPLQAGSWRREAVRFCLNPTCQLVNVSAALELPERCSACGGKLDDMSEVERSLLPRDTWLRRADYQAPDGNRIKTTLVISGRERASIHRPEVCLSAAGSEIIGSEVIRVPLSGRRDLDVRLLTRRLTGDGRTSYSYLAYWFAARDRETASHYQRMLWMAEDRIVRGVTRRWAYISIAGPLGPDREQNLEVLRGFVRDLHPLLVRP